MPVAFRKLAEQFRIERQAFRGIHRVHPILFVNRLAQYDSPPAGALLEKIVETASANHVAQDIVNGGALRDGHLGLRNSAVARLLYRNATHEVEDADAAIPAFPANADELGR